MIGRLGGLAAAAAMLTGGSALAQEAAPATTAPVGSEVSTQSFEPAYFVRYAPNNALDMIQQVPGFSVEEGDSVRGFGGAAGNILVNGERPSTKTGLAALLTRIPVASIIRVDLVTGVSATLDMRGQTRIVNVIVRESALAEPIAFDITARYTTDGRIAGLVQASTQRSLFGGALNVSGTLTTLTNNGPGGGGFVDGARLRYNAVGAQTEYGEGFTEGQPVIGQLNLEYERDLGWAALHLNGGYSAVDGEGDRFWKSYVPDSTGPLAGLETNQVRNRDRSFTLGGDLERKFGEIDFKIITFNKRSQGQFSTRFATFTPPGALIVASTSEPDSDSGESILRGQANWILSKSHSLEIAAETAYNFLDSVTGFVRETPTARTAFFIDGSDTRVEEFRNEFQISDVWTVSPEITIEPGFKFETSRIVQEINYATAPALHEEREFEYPKPSITAAWRIQPGRQLRLSYKREVAQLSFSDFVSSVELRDNLTTGGNKDLVPERTWAFNAELEQRFWTGGVLTLFASFDEVEDAQDYVALPVSTAGGLPVLNTFGFPTFVDAPGNIGDGTRWSAGFRATVPMEQLGLNGARIDVFLVGGGSEVTDPVTGRTREFSDEFKESWSLAFRQDFPAEKFSYGFKYEEGRGSTAYRYNEASRRSRDDGDLSFWIETSRWFGLRIRAGIDDNLAAEFARTRVVYQGARETSPLNFVEKSRSSNGARPFIRVSGKF